MALTPIAAAILFSDWRPYGSPKCFTHFEFSDHCANVPSATGPHREAIARTNTDSNASPDTVSNATPFCITFYGSEYVALETSERCRSITCIVCVWFA